MGGQNTGLYRDYGQENGSYYLGFSPFKWNWNYVQMRHVVANFYQRAMLGRNFRCSRGIAVLAGHCYMRPLQTPCSQQKMLIKRSASLLNLEENTPKNTQGKQSEPRLCTPWHRKKKNPRNTKWFLRSRELRENFSYFP